MELQPSGQGEERGGRAEQAKGAPQASLAQQLPLGLGGGAQGPSGAACPGTDIFSSSVFQICPEQRTRHGLGQ